MLCRLSFAFVLALFLIPGVHAAESERCPAFAQVPQDQCLKFYDDLYRQVEREAGGQADSGTQAYLAEIRQTRDLIRAFMEPRNGACPGHADAAGVLSRARFVIDATPTQFQGMLDRVTERIRSGRAFCEGPVLDDRHRAEARFHGMMGEARKEVPAE
jgi:hypothetical protein